MGELLTLRSVEELRGLRLGMKLRLAVRYLVKEKRGELLPCLG